MNETIQEINPQQPNQESVGNGQVKLENSCGIEISTSVTNLSSINFKKYRDNSCR